MENDKNVREQNMMAAIQKKNGYALSLYFGLSGSPVPPYTYIHKVTQTHTHSHVCGTVLSR